MFLNETTKQVQEMVRQFADTKIRPNRQRIGPRHAIPRRSIPTND